VDALDDSGSAKHAGFEDKEARRQRRQKRLEKAGLSKRRLTEENPECVILLWDDVLTMTSMALQGRPGTGLCQTLTPC